MRHILRQLVKVTFGRANPRAGTGLLTCAVTLASALWVSVSVPSMLLLRGLDDRAGTSVSISLQSALLGIDDRSGRQSDAQALARALGLSDGLAKLLSGGGLRDRGNSRVARSAFEPLSAQLDPRALTDLVPAVQPLDAQSQLLAAEAHAMSGSNEATPHSDNSTPASQPKDEPVAAAPLAPVAPPAHPKSGPTPAPATPSQPPAPPPPAAEKPHDGHATEPPADPGPGEGKLSGIVDVTAPAIHAHADLVLEAVGPGGANVSYTMPTATDDLDGAVSVLCAPASGHVFGLGHTNVSCTATDAAHNTAHSSFDILVRDTTGPAIQAHADLVAEATGPGGANVSYTMPAASDAVDGAVSTVCAPSSGHAFGLGHATVHCTATDAANNTTHSSFDVVVGDTTPPVIQAHADIDVDAAGPGGANVSYTPPSATDSVDGAVSTVCAPSSGHAFGLGHATVHCTATDAAHNTAHSTFDVVVGDTTAPVIQARADVLAEAVGPSGATVVYTAPTANDSLDGPVAVSCAPASGSTFPLGHTTVTCSAHDAAGNAASPQTFDVHVRDTTAPTMQAHADVIAEADNSGGATVNYTAPAASDSVDTSVAVTCAPASGTAFAFGHTTVTCSAHDASGNSAPSQTFDVQVHDTTAPAIQAHADVVAEATSSGGATVSYTPPTASDAVDGAVTVTCAPASGTAFALGHTTVTCTAQDARSNVAHSTFDVAVADTTAPVIQTPADISVPDGTVVTFTATATDAVDGTDPVTCTPGPGGTFAAGQTVVTCTAHDAAGNEATSQTFDVFVTTLPSHSDAVHALLDVDHVLNGLGASHAAETDLHHQLIDVAGSVLDDDPVATCQAFDAFTASAQAQLTAGQFASLSPSIDAARTTLGC